jgi:uncharacterized membrane protein YhaH (DUF805 family)
LGRAARADYWYWLIVPAFGAGLAILGLGQLILSPTGFHALAFVAFAVFVLSHTIVSIRRLHDLSMTGWWAAALIIPPVIAGWYYLDPGIIDFEALLRADDATRLVGLVAFSAAFAPFAYVLGLIWFVMGKDGVNRYGHDPLYR